MSKFSYALTKDLFMRDLGTEGIVLSSVDLCYYRTNPIGTRILEILAESKQVHEDLETFIDECTETFHLTREQIETDVLDYLRDLETSHVVERI